MGDAPIEGVMAYGAEYEALPPPPGAPPRPGAHAGRYKDVPLVTWTFEGGDRHGVFTRAEPLTRGFDARPGFHTTIHGDKGMIEVMGESASGLRWEGEPCELLLRRREGAPEAMRIDDEHGAGDEVGADRVWDSKVSYYGGAHIRQVHDFIDAIVEGRPARHGPDLGTADVACALAAILSIREGRPIRLSEVPEDFTAFGAGFSRNSQ